MDVLQHALAWINQYGDAAAPCENVLDLCDGVAFARVLAALAPDWFTLDGVRTDASANWVLAQNNLRTVLRNMEDYYRTVLRADMDFGAVDANAIARKDGDVVDQLLQVTELLVGLAVQCENKARHVGVIMGLPVESQTSLQYLIQQALSKARPYSVALDSTAEADAPQPLPLPPGGGDHALSADAAAAVAALQQQLAAAEAAAADLRKQLLAESRACEELQDENRALREVTAAAARSGGSGGAHAEGGEGAAAAAAAALAGARAQVAELQAALEEREREAADARDAARRAAALRDRDAALRATLEADARRMADELDLAQGAAARLRAAEASLERYRARLEELAPLREHVRELEQQSAQYLEQILTLEGEVKAMDTLRRKVEQYKDEKIEMERTSFQAASALTLKQDEVTRLKASLQEALDAKRYFENELIGARDAARAQGVARGESGDGGSGSTADAGGGGGGSGGLGLFESAATLSEKVQRLQRENAALRAQLGGGGDGGGSGSGGDTATAAELRGELEDALRAKRERGDEALAAKRQAAELEAQVHQLQERLASAEGRESAAQGAHSTAQLREMAQTVARLEAEADKARGLEMTLKYLEEQLKQKETELNTQQSDKAKLEQYMKRMFAKFKQDKAQAMRDVTERDAHIAALAEKGRADQAAFKREQQLMMSAVYEMGADISARHLRASMAPSTAPPRPHGSGAGAGGSGSGTWMQQQRDMMQHRRDLG